MTTFPTKTGDGSADWPQISQEIWDMKYRLKAADGAPIDQTFADTVARVAGAVAAAEAPKLRATWAAAFQDALAERAFVPGGRILAGAGAKRRVTLFNCFVLGRIEDDLGAIFDAVKEAALTMQAGGGIGHDFSSLRPRGALVRSIGADASGPIAFMDIWDSMCRSVMSAGARRGAMMGTLRCDHPDIEAFIDVKRDAKRLRNFNLSVLVTDAFVEAVRRGDAWPLVFDGRVYKTVAAKDLWARLMRATFDVAEPGVIFIDRVNADNNLAYCETITATNPCGEQPLPPYGACMLGAINLAQLVGAPFEDGASLDEARLTDLVRVAVRFLDNTIDVSRYPLPAQKREAFAKRRIGLGVTGLGDALVMLGVRYGSPEAVRLVDRWLGAVKRAAYEASADLAAEKGAFALCDRAALLKRPNVAGLPEAVRCKIERSGLRNGVLTTIAPTGTTSLLAGNVSSGIEPIFDVAFTRKIVEPNGDRREEMVEDYAYRTFRRLRGMSAPLPAAFVTVADLAPQAHLEMQAAAQANVDSAISKTINCPENIAFSEFETIYLRAHELGLKGCTTYRPNAVTGSVLSSEKIVDGVRTSVDDAAAVVVSRVPATGDVAAQLPAVARLAAVPPATADVIYMSKPLEREPVLSGLTYKLKWPRSEHAIYITINDIVHDGRRRPFEIFINSKNLEHTAWSLALTRMISAIFRRGGDLGFVAEELKAVFDPQGGAWMDGRYVPSVHAAIGGVIETHLTQIGGDGRHAVAEAVAAPVALAVADGARALSARGLEGGGAVKGKVGLCPKCQQQSFVRQDGCAICRTCGFSQCD
jgi:ribonucleoside-diphosphate reductase alpha chain